MSFGQSTLRVYLYPLYQNIYIYIFVSTTFTEKILYALQITWRNAGSTFRFTYARVNVENEIYR